MKSTTRRTLTCKNFTQPSLEAGNEDLGQVLEKATVALQNDEPVLATYESLYNGIKDRLELDSATNLYQKLETTIATHTKNMLDSFKSSNLDQVAFLETMNKSWKNNIKQMLMLRGIYLYLDRKYVLPNSNLLSIWDLAIDKFRLFFSKNVTIQNNTIDGCLKLIQQERQGAAIDRTLVKDLLSMLSTLSIYRTAFEPKFFDETRKLYQLESQRLINELDVPGYLKYVSRTISEESLRSVHYLESLTQVPLIDIVEKELIAVHLKRILTKGLDQLLDDMRMADLSLLHSLLGRVDEGLQELCTHFNKHIKQRGQLIVTDADRDKTMVQDLLLFKERMDKVVSEAFQKQEKFVYSLKEAFEYFINQRPNKPAELIAKYIDSKLKTGNKEATEDELEKMLDQILVLFRFIHGKDVFEAFYKKDLAKRLLVNKSASIDAEKSMLSKLKQECGAAFTGKLEGMFRDVELSKDMMINFKNYMSSHQIDAQIDMTVNVLTMGYWPTYEQIEVNLPSFLKRHQKSFEEFYFTKHNGRKLQWQPNLDQCSIIADFRNQEQESHKYELLVSLFQALVLLLFNEKDEVSYKDIQESTKIEHVELRRTLQSLACGKVRVITKEPKSKDINDDDTFHYNGNFKYHLHKIKINQVQMKETHEEQSMTEERVFQDRQYQIDAAIVRIMKTRKKLSHTSLVTEVFKHVQFPVRAQDVKVRIESLIERDYIQRDQENANQYNYVA